MKKIGRVVPPAGMSQEEFHKVLSKDLAELLPLFVALISSSDTVQALPIRGGLVEVLPSNMTMEPVEFVMQHDQKPVAADLSIDDARNAGDVCRTCRSKLASAPFANNGKQRCMNQRCVACCGIVGCAHARSL